MKEDAFLHRARTLEDRFFAQKDAELLDKIRQQRFEEITAQDLGEATGITDPALLGNLAKLKLSRESLAALSVVPLVEVAWADGSIAEDERAAVLKAALESGLPKDGPGYRQLQVWLETRPNPELLGAWKDYIAALSKHLSDADHKSVRDNLLARTKQVAQAAGGYLGFASISPSEQKVLDQLATAFDK